MITKKIISEKEKQLQKADLLLTQIKLLTLYIYSEKDNQKGFAAKNVPGYIKERQEYINDYEDKQKCLVKQYNELINNFKII